MTAAPSAPGAGNRQKGKRMDIATWLIVGIALALVLIAYRRGDGALAVGFHNAWSSFLQFLPLLVAIFVLIGFSEVLLPREVIARWLGRESGLKGILIASGVGALIPGGPFVSFPLIASLYKAGAGIGPVVAFVTAWSLWSLTRLPMEFAILGPRLMFARLVSTILFPPLAGLIAAFLFERAA
jgi:uncharacterized membrane protein YraQ (UPF0718 family)